MDTTDIIVIVCVLTAVALLTLWWGAATAYDLDEEKTLHFPKFETGKVTFPHCTDEEKHKRKKKRYYSKKKKQAVAETAPTEKRSVGRPKKSN